MFSSLKEAIGFSANRLPNDSGYTWTLTSCLGQFLHDAEGMFGPRDMTWTPLGIEFCGDIPHLWFPNNVKNVSIVLTDKARTDPAEALFELAHEVVHLLSPTGSRQTQVLEEGLATWFADNRASLLGLGIHSNISSYVEAKLLVEELLKIRATSIAEIRSIEPNFFRITPELVCGVVGAPQELAEKLCRPFERNL